MSHPTVVVNSPDSDEFAQLAQLAFASRHSVLLQSQARGLAFLPPDALDMDLTDPMQRDFGDYELREKIGQGGMGVVYRAHQKSLDREVALKLLAAGPWASSLFVERFRREAQSAARLEHPNIVAVFEAGTHHDLHYFSMRLVRGESLATHLQRVGPMPPRHAAQVLRVVADAVDFAHRLGVLHLDLKPGNVLLDEHGEPMVADFGLARRLDHALAEDGEDVSGTPAYMAPEQATGSTQQFGRSTDIYGLGSILYEMLCGRPPFLAATPQATLELVARGNPRPPRELRRDVPADLQAICLKCLSKTAGQRYATAAALAEDLRRFLDDRPVSVRSPPPLERITRWVRREPRLAAAGAAVAFALAAGLTATAQQWQRAEHNAEASQQLLWEGRREAALNLENEGRGLEALSRLLSNVSEQELEAGPGAAQMDRTRLGLILGQGATLIDRALVSGADPLAAALSPDGKHLALAFNDRSVRWYASDTLAEAGQVSLAGVPTSDGEPRVPLHLEFISPTRLRVRLEWYGFLAAPQDGDSWIIDIAKAQVLQPPPTFDDFADAVFSADGNDALLRNRHGDVEIWQVDPWQLRRRVADAGHSVVNWKLGLAGAYAFGLGDGGRDLTLFSLADDPPSTQTVRVPDEAGFSAWAESGDGKQLALGDFRGRVYLVDIESGRWRRLPGTRAREITWLAFSEDDVWLACASYDGSLDLFDTLSGDSVGAGEMRVDFAPQQVAVSRAQRFLVASGTGQSALWRIPRAGVRAGQPRRVGLSPAAHELTGRYPFGWSLEQGLMVGAGMDGQVRLWRLPPAVSSARLSGLPHQETLHYSDSIEAQVHWSQLRVSRRGGRDNGDWMSLPEPPSFVGLVDRGNLLLFSTADELHALDTLGLTPRHAATALPSTPQRVLASADGSHVLLSFGSRGPGGLQESLRLLNARSGEWRPGSIDVPSQVLQYAFSPDHSRILAVGPKSDATRLIRREDLSVLAEFPHDPFEPVVAADFRDNHLIMALRAEDRRMGRDHVLVWDPTNDLVLQQFDIGPALPRALLVNGKNTFVMGDAFDVMIRQDGSLLRLPRASRQIPTYVATLSRDGRVLARGFRFEVQLHDTRTGDLLGSLLASDLQRMDYISMLAFSPDRKELIGNSVLGHRLRWRIAPVEGDIGPLQRSLHHLMPQQAATIRLELPDANERRALRAADPGAWLRTDAMPSVARAPHAPAGVWVPARPGTLSPQLLDLSAFYHRGPFDVGNSFRNYRAGMYLMPLGRLRIAGVDFDVRGVIQLQRAATVGSDAPTSRRVECIPLGSQPVEALHVLAGVGLSVPAPHRSLMARLTFRYRDGGSAAIDLLAGIDLPGYLNDRAVPQAYTGDPVYYRSGASDGDHLSVRRVANPHPGRELRCFDFELVRSGALLALYGVTVEGPDGLPVIAAESFRSNL